MSKPVFQFSTKYETDFQQEFRELLQAFESLQADHEALLKLYQEAKQSNKNGEKFLIKQSETIKKLTDTISDYEQVQASWSKQQHARTAEEEQSIRLLGKSTSAIATQKKQIESLTNILESLNSEHHHALQKQQAKIEKHWQAKINEKQAKIDDLQEQLATATKWQNTYKDELAKERQIKTQFKDQNSILNEQNTKLSAQIATLRSQNSEQASNHNTLTGLITKFKAMFNA